MIAILVLIVVMIVPTGKWQAAACHHLLTNSKLKRLTATWLAWDIYRLADKYDKQQRDAATWQWDDISTRKNWKNCYNYRSCYSCCCCCCSCCTRPSPAYPTLPQLLHTSKVPFPVARTQKISRPEYAKKPLFGVDAGIIFWFFERVSSFPHMYIYMCMHIWMDGAS